MSLALGWHLFAFADFSGHVVSVLDGDTIEVLHNNRAERIRLSGSDCPEKGQAFGNRAKQAASALVLGESHASDLRQGQVRAHPWRCVLRDGTNVNHTLVTDGWCWWYRKYAPLDVELENLEHEAREGKEGLWADPSPIPPWVYRKARRGQSLDLSDLVALEGEPERSGATRGLASIMAWGVDEELHWPDPL
jgi:micrococcal nuclease